MMIIRWSTHALCMSIAVAFLGGCSGFGMPASTSAVTNSNNLAYGAAETGSIHGYQLLYAFNGGEDGALPEAGLLDVNDTLYGTTVVGGGAGCEFNYGCGTVFKISTGGAERVLYGFKNDPDGSYPYAGLTDVKGTLYGTTSRGGAQSDGTVFKISTSGTSQTIYTFKGSNGLGPVGNLTELNGVLYSTTTYGGGNGCMLSSTCGTVFGVTGSGKKRLQYAFGNSNSHDAARPYAGLVAFACQLIGTTVQGGANGLGAVFEIAPSGKERVVFSFNGSDGMFPTAPLIVMQGKLYGTTESGGTKNNGTVFEVSTSGKEKTLYRFKGGKDGAAPQAGLVAVNGALYGTTYAGGGSGCSWYGGDSPGCGTIFKITRGGTESVIYRFKGGQDGEAPAAPLVAVNGALYGTTAAGGPNSCPPFLGTYYTGCGTVFKISPIPFLPLNTVKSLPDYHCLPNTRQDHP